MTAFLIILIISFIFIIGFLTSVGLVCVYFAKKKLRSVVGSFSLGFFLSIIGLMIVLKWKDHHYLLKMYNISYKEIPDTVRKNKVNKAYYQNGIKLDLSEVLYIIHKTPPLT